MILEIPDVLSRDEAAEFRERLLAADWADGRGTAGHLSAEVKRNRQLHWQHPEARELGAIVLARLERNPMLLSAALPRRFLPPLFNRYGPGEEYGDHIDGAIRAIEGTAERLRTDLSFTLMLSAPGDYTGGDLVVVDAAGSRAVRLAAGSMILYPSSSVHRVEMVTRGERVAAFGWIESLVQDEGARRLLFELDVTIQRLGQAESAPASEILSLTNLYHNLVRRWAKP